jgi:hypothetical protein
MWMLIVDCDPFAVRFKHLHQSPVRITLFFYIIRERQVQPFIESEAIQVDQSGHSPAEFMRSDDCAAIAKIRHAERNQRDQQPRSVMPEKQDGYAACDQETETKPDGKIQLGSLVIQIMYVLRFGCGAQGA